LGSIGHHLPLPAAISAQIGGNQEQPLPARDFTADKWPEVLIMIKNGCGRNVLPGQQPPRTVEVGHDGIQELRALHETRLERGPLPVVKNERQWV
jgi:hypothetical protein